MAKIVSAKQRILDLLNELNLPPKALTAINVKFGQPEVLPDEGLVNTKVTISAVPGRGYSGSVDITYRRLAIGEILQAPTLRSLDPFTEDLVLASINNAFGLFLTVDDMQPFDIPEIPAGESQVLQLRAKEGSLGWLGGVDITLEHAKPTLDLVVGIRTLPIFRHFAEPSKGLNARMVTWGTDFSSLQAAIKLNYKGEYTDWDALQDACARVGIPGWTQGTAVDKATSEVPDSNPAFQRVVIQQLAVSAGMSGPIYLHYNPL